jgi:hypothetical protein
MWCFTVIAIVAVSWFLPWQPALAGAEDLIVPGSWAGVWKTTITSRHPAPPNNVVAVDEITEVICAKAPIALPLVRDVASCTAETVSATRIDVTCVADGSEGGCNASGDLHLDITRNGNTFSGSGAWQATVNGACGPLVSGGETFQIVGTRLNTRQPGCAQSSTTLLQKFVTHPLLVALTVKPFTTFTVDKVEIEDDAFEVKGGFTLGTGSNGIDPRTEEVTLQVGNFTTTIPVGSFKLKKGEFKFEGRLAGVELEVKITPSGNNAFKLKAEGEGADLAGTENPVVVSLAIGNDGGNKSVTAEIDDD